MEHLGPICNNGICPYKIDINKLKEEMANENSRRRLKESNDTNVYTKAAKNIAKVLQNIKNNNRNVIQEIDIKIIIIIKIIVKMKTATKMK